MKKFILLLVLLSYSTFASGWSLSDTEGKTVALDQYRGKWVLVNFWATWCPPCLAEIPDLERAYAEGKIRVVGIAVNYRNREEVIDFARKEGITYPVVLGSEDIAADFGGFEGLPTSFLYTPEGKLAGIHQGPLSEKDLQSIITGSPSRN